MRGSATRNTTRPSTALERGLGKPGVKDEAEARLLLGIAQLGAGKKEEAEKTFKAVKGDAEDRAPRHAVEPARAPGLEGDSAS